MSPRFPCRVAGSLKAIALSFILVVFAFGPELALAQSKSVDPFGVPSIMVEEPQTPKHPNRADEDKPHSKKHEERGVNIPRGSANFVPPAQLPRTPLLAPPRPVAPYSPPPISNPSERITQFNHSFPLNGGLGNNPTDRDAYIRYNFNR
jgi:hypothetical protein